MIKETNDYTLAVGEAINPASDKVTQAYQLTNKVTGLIEIETTVLPEAYMLLEQYQAELDRFASMEFDASIDLSDNVRTLN